MRPLPNCLSRACKWRLLSGMILQVVFDGSLRLKDVANLCDLQKPDVNYIGTRFTVYICIHNYTYRYINIFIRPFIEVFNSTYNDRRGPPCMVNQKNLGIVLNVIRSHELVGYTVFPIFLVRK